MEFKSANYSEAFKRFAEWVEKNENLLNSTCHCCPKPTQQQATTTSNSNNKLSTNKLLANGTNGIIRDQSVVIYHQNLQTEVEDYGKLLNQELKRHLSEDKTCTKEQSDAAFDLEERWHKLWLKSLEQLVVVERTRRCPTHNSTIIGKPSPTTKANNGINKTIGVRTQRRRPISYPNVNINNRLEWDYQHTLSLTGCHKENGSHIDLDSVDEQTTKDLTEFGENYEVWLGKEEEIAYITMHSRPPSVEPAEKPEIAKAVVASNSNLQNDVNCNLLMLTTPSSMFSVATSKCLHQEKQSYTWRFVGAFLIGLFVFIFSTFYSEPHHLHKSYYHTQPPV